MKYKINIFILFFCICLTTGCKEDTLCLVQTENMYAEEEISYLAKEEVSNESKETLTVYVCGAVYFPGVYTVYSESRLCDVVKAAGGFTEDADIEKVNLARKVCDEEQIIIPDIRAEIEETESKLIDINSATEEMLCTISGIGSTRAKQIIEYRETYGRFQKIEDIMNVSGIKESTFEKIAPYITVF